MIVALSDFFHFTVSEHSIFTTVGQEVAFAKNYVYLQQCRFGMALQVHFDVNPDTENNLTLRLLLQPLIENAIVHGVMSSTSGGTVRIWIAREHSPLYIKAARSSFNEMVNGVPNWDAYFISLILFHESIEPSCFR